MKIAIIGIGAMGCLFAALLEGVAEPIMIGSWPEQIAAVRGRGLRLLRPDGRETIHRVAITDVVDEVGKVDLALVLVKSRQTAAAAEVAAEVLTPNGLALTLQNGLNNLEQLVVDVGPERAALGVTSEGATLLEPGVVRHAGYGKTHLSYESLPVSRIQLPYDLFRAAGLETYLVKDADDIVWNKLAVNAAINPLTALLRVPNGFLVEHEETRALMRLIAAEVAAVAQAQGINLSAVKAGDRAVEVAQATAANHSSMLQDVERDVPTEIDAICGAIVETGERLNIPVPLNRELLRLVHAVEDGHWPIAADGDPTALLSPLSETLFAKTLEIQ